MKKRILITDRFAHESWLFLQQNPNFELFKTQSPNTIDPELIATSHALLIRSRTPIDEKLLKSAKNLQLIITTTSGFDHIDLKATQKWGITVMHTPEAHIESAAQLTWALVLSCCSRVHESDKIVRGGNWDRSKVVGMEVSGRHYGIVGLGRIGSRVAQMAQAFGMSVIAYDPYQEDEVFEKLKIPRVSYDELLRNADIISFHVPKTGETKHMLKQSQFENIQHGVILINTSRGPVIHEQDLCAALDKTLIKAVGLDVFEKEPLQKTSKLFTYPQVILTPHIGANTEEAFHKASQSAAEKCMRFFVDSTTSDTLPPKAAWYGAMPFGESSAE